jgi:hypothetical protein
MPLFLFDTAAVDGAATARARFSPGEQVTVFLVLCAACLHCIVVIRLLYAVVCVMRGVRDQDANAFVEFVCGDLQQATMKAYVALRTALYYTELQVLDCIVSYQPQCSYCAVANLLA